MPQMRAIAWKALFALAAVLPLCLPSTAFADNGTFTVTFTPSTACRPAPDGIFDVTGNDAPYMTFSCAPTQVVVGGNPLGALCCNDYVAAQINAPAGITLTDATSLGNVELNKGSGWAADSFFNGGELSVWRRGGRNCHRPAILEQLLGIRADLPRRGKLHRRRRC